MWDALEAIFILNDERILDEKKERVVDVLTVKRARHGLKPLIIHFGLTSEEDSL